MVRIGEGYYTVEIDGVEINYIYIYDRDNYFHVVDTDNNVLEGIFIKGIDFDFIVNSKTPGYNKKVQFKILRKSNIPPT